MPQAELHELAERYRPEFPVFDGSVYLNSCSLGALSRRARDSVAEFLDLWSSLGAAAWYGHWLDAARDLRDSFARLIGAESSEVALAPSVSGALATLTSGIDFRDRPRVITTELDFPTLVYHFLAKRPLGVETVVLPSPDGIAVPVDAFAEAVDERTALIATSHVHYTTGAIQDVGALARLAHDHGALCLIDAYQSTGQVPTDVRALDLDFLVTGGLKWLLGGPGLAYLYVRGDRLDELTPSTVSWFGVADQFEFDPTRLALRPDARRFELGTPSIPSVYAGRAGLEIIHEIGVDRIRRRVASLTEDLIDRAREASLRVQAAARAADRSGIVLIEQTDAEDSVRRLAAGWVIVDRRGNRVRLSPHFYNTTEDNARAIELLAS